jgi:cystathionine beta-synthase
MSLDRAKNVVESVTELIGNTPLVKLSSSLREVPAGGWLRDRGFKAPSFSLKSELYAKVESLNPGGSVKDRIALKIIEGAEKSGRLKPGGLIIEATSGNTGAGLAMVAATRGYKCVFVMPDKMSAEKVNALRAYGAKVVVSPMVEPHDPSYYVNFAKRLAAETPGAFLANQFFNPDNPLAHFESTGPEIWDQMETRIDAFFAGMGTGGTFTGTSRFLKQQSSTIKTIGVDPVGSIYHGLVTNKKAGPVGSYLVEGVGEDMVPGTIDLSLADDCVFVNDQEAMSATQMLARSEGLLVGGSCGMAFFGAVQYLAWHEGQGGRPMRAVVILPDSGSRYLSKVFNDPWLRKQNVDPVWGSSRNPGSVEYLPNARLIEGV